MLSSWTAASTCSRKVVGGDQPSQWSRHRILLAEVNAAGLDHEPPRGRASAVPENPVLEVQGPLPRAHPVGDLATTRLVAAYLDRPLFPDNFSAHEVLVPPSQLGMHDWRTFYQGGTRLIEYLNHLGYGGLVLSVYADGSTIYPSRLLEPTTRYDTGEFSPPDGPSAKTC